MNDAIIGILGGMGPEATADFYLKLIKATEAGKDQDHFRVIIDSNAKIPDRTGAILGEGPSPVREMLHAAKNLETLKVDLACIPCITAHYFIDRVQKEVSYPIINVFQEISRYLYNYYPSLTRVGVLATTGVLKTKLFDNYLKHMQIIYPDPVSQEEKVMKAVYGEKGIKCGFKQGEPVELLNKAAGELTEGGAEMIIAGCTEIGMVLKEDMVDMPLLDPMQVMARAVVRQPMLRCQKQDKSPKPF